MQLSGSDLSKKRRAVLYENSNVEWFEKENPFIEKPVPLDAYERIGQIGIGTYGSVDKAKSPSGKIVALKRLLLEKESSFTGFPVTALREIKILSCLDHRNIVKLLDVVTCRDEENSVNEVFLVLEYADHDLAGLMANPEIKFEEKNIKFYMKNLFEALYYLQEKCKVLHRDIKSSNILVGNDDSVKLGDFGLARLLRCDGRKHYTKTVVTLWYRAPELLFGESCYDGAVDIWSAGCVLAEMYLGKPLFPGNTEAEQIDRICSVVGTPSKDSYPEGLNFDVRCSKKYPRDFSRMKIVKDKSPLAFDLLTKILVLDPKKRLTAEKILDHDYFHIGDKAEPLDLRHILPSHEFESQKRRRERREKTRNKKEKSKNIEPKEDLFDGEELKKLKEERLERENVQIESDSLSEFSSNDENVHSGSEPGEIVVQSD